MSERECAAGKDFHDEWIEDLCHLIPEGDESRYSNPEGAVEAIILDCFRAYVAERDRLAATVERVRALCERPTMQTDWGEEGVHVDDLRAALDDNGGSDER